MEFFQQFYSSGTAKIINIIILLLFFIALYRLFKYLKILNNEKDNLLELKKFVESEELKTVDDFAEKIRYLNKNSVVTNRLSTIVELYYDNAEFNYEVFEKVNNKFPLKISNFAFLVSTILISFGLLGTIIGLSSSLSEIKATMEFKSISYFKEKLELILSGMYTAFSTTILGILCTLVLLFALTLLRKYYTNLSTEIDSYFNTTIAKYYIKRKSEYNYTHLIESITNFTRTIIENITALTTQNKDVTKGIVQATQNIADNNETLIGVFEKLRYSIQELLDTNKIDDLKNYQDQIRIAFKDNNQISEKLKGSAESISKKTSENIEKINSLVETIKEQNKMLNSNLDKNDENYKKLETFVDNLKEINENNKNDRSEIKNNIDILTDNFNTLITNYKDTNEKIDNSINIKLINEINNANKKLNDSIDGKVKEINDKVLTVIDNFNKCLTTISDTTKVELEKNTNLYKNSLDDIKKIYDDLQTKSQENLLKNIDENNNKILDKFEEDFNNINKKQEELINSGYSLLFTNIDKLINEKFSAIDKSQVNNDINIDTDQENKTIEAKEIDEKQIDNTEIKENQATEEIKKADLEDENNKFNAALIQLFNKQQEILQEINNNLIKLNNKSIFNFIKNLFFRK